MDSGLVARLRAAGCVFAEDEAELLLAEFPDADALEAATVRRVAGEPLEVIVGWAQFCGLRLTVAPGVFVPRHRSELLVEQTAALLRPGDVLLDLCCGVGAIAAAVAAVVPDLEVHVSDLDAAATDCARRNIPGAGITTGDLFDPLPGPLRGRVDVLVANAPYVPSGELELMPREAREHERRPALDGGADGLELHRRIAAGAPEWLRPGGALLMECSARQAKVSRGILESAGFEARVVHEDERDATVLVALVR